MRLASAEYVTKRALTPDATHPPDPRTVDGPPRSMRPFTTSSGVICGLALDHRDAMRNAFNRVGMPDVSQETMVETKERIIGALAERASALLLDPATLARCRPPRLGVFIPLEMQGHDQVAGGRRNRLLEGFGPSDVVALRGEGCKLLVYYRADHSRTADTQLALAVQVAAECHRVGLPLMVEPIVYRIDSEDEEHYRRRFGSLVAAAAHDLASCGADVLKLQFPGDDSACRRVSEAAGKLPWTLLGGSDVDGESFHAQLRVACRAGASGFMAGRAIWGGVLGRESSDQTAWLKDYGRPLFERLADTTDTDARRIR
jgi:tagatose-1,6-bisphosphate aldolase